MADAKPKTKTTYVRASAEIAQRVKDEAAARDLGERFIVDRALEDFLGRLTPVDEFRLTRPREDGGES